jgi:hypothetical protein
MEHLELLFAAKINVPKACEIVGATPCEESWETMKQEFAAWCKEQPLRHRFTDSKENL